MPAMRHLCNAFPTLFDLIDDSDTMEVDLLLSHYSRSSIIAISAIFAIQQKVPTCRPMSGTWTSHLMPRAKAIKFKRVIPNSETTSSPALTWLANGVHAIGQHIGQQRKKTARCELHWTVVWAFTKTPSCRNTTANRLQATCGENIQPAGQPRL